MIEDDDEKERSKMRIRIEVYHRIRESICFDTEAGVLLCSLSTRKLGANFVLSR